MVQTILFPFSLFIPLDIFSMISDTSGVMVYGRYDMFLREVLKLPTAVFEGPSFGYTEQSAKSCFSQQVDKHDSTLIVSPPPPSCPLAVTCNLDFKKINK